jgi:hypothetical protein
MVGNVEVDSLPPGIAARKLKKTDFFLIYSDLPGESGPIRRAGAVQFGARGWFNSTDAGSSIRRARLPWRAREGFRIGGEWGARIDGWRGSWIGRFLSYPTGQEFLIVLFVLVPLVALIKDSCKTDDQQKGDQEHHRIKISAVRFHVGSSVPAGRKIDDDGYNEQ